MSAKQKHEKALKVYQNWIMFECGLEPLENHGKSPMQIGSELQAASMAYLGDLVFHGAMAVTMTCKSEGDDVVAFYFKDDELYVRNSNTVKFTRVEKYLITNQLWGKIPTMLTKDQNEAYLTRGIGIQAALSLSGSVVDVNSLFYSEDVNAR